MAMRFTLLTNLFLVFVAILVLVHASARNLQQTQTLPLHGAASPTKAESPNDDAHVDDRKNFIIGGAAGVGGFMGMPGGGMTFPGTPVLGGTGAFGGLGGAMGFPGAAGGGSVPSSGSGLVSP